MNATRRRHAHALSAALVAAAPVLEAQESRPKLALDLTAGVAAQLSRRMNQWCSPRGSFAGGVGAVWRPVRLLVLEGVAARAAGFRPHRCPSFPPTPVASQGRVVLSSENYERDPDDGPQLTTALRAGLEVGGGRARVRVLGGAGRMWEARLPYRSLTGALTVGRGTARLLVEGDYWRYDPPGRTRIVVIVDGQEVSRTERRFSLAEHTLYGRVGIEVVPRRRRHD